MTAPTPEPVPSRAQLEEQLIDYLYGELEPEQRAALERALPAHPDLAQELERHRWTRARMAELPMVPLPAGALDQALLAAERHIQTVGPAPAPPGFFARLGKLFLQPAFATAFVAVLGVGIGLFMSRSRDLPVMGPSADDQVGASLGASRPEDKLVPAVRVPEHARESKNELAAATADAPEVPKAVERTAPASEALAIAEPALPAASPAGEARAGVGQAGGPAREARKELDRSAAAGGTIAKTAKPEAGEPAALDGFGAAEAERDSAADRTPAPGLTDPATNVWDGAARLGDAGDEDLADRSKATATTGGAATTNIDEATRPPQPAPTARTPTADEETYVLSERESKKVSIDDEAKPKGAEPRITTTTEKAPVTAPTPTEAGGDRRASGAPTTPTPDTAKPAARPADKSEERAETKTDTKAAPPSEEKLWTTYQQQLAAGAFADAQKTLADLLKLTGDTAKLKAARADLSKREAETRRADPTKAPAEKLPPDPSGPAPGRAP